MSQTIDSFNPFVVHPFTSGGGQPGNPSVPRALPTSSPIKQAMQIQQQQSPMYIPHQRRGDPSTPPGGYVPPPPRQQPAQSKHVFDVYKADGRRTPDLQDILNKNGGQRWK